MKPDEIIAEARTWIGTPFRHQAHVKGVGADCIGLIYGVITNVGLIDTTLPAYGREPQGNRLEIGIGQHLDKVHDLKPADVMVFRFVRHSQHVALFTGDTIIHSYSSIGKVIEHRLDDRWRQRHTMTFRLKGLQYE